MAGVKKTKDVEVIETETKVESVPVVDDENERLKAELADLKAQMAIMMQAMAQNKPMTATKEDDNRRIPFYNMTASTMIVKGTNTYRFDKQFESRTFTKREAIVIVNNMPNAIRMGKLYIADADFVKECDFDTAYESILSNKALEDLLKHDSSYVVDVYKNANKGQQDIIVDMLINRKINRESVDANVLVEIGNLSGRDLMSIEPFVE